MTRAEAKAKNLLKYFNGNPCVHGHLADRYTKSGKCVDCAKIDVRSQSRKDYFKNLYIENGEQRRQQVRDAYHKNKEHYKAKVKDWQDNNKEKVSRYKRNNKYKRRIAESEGASNKILNKWESKQPKVCYICGCSCVSDYHIDHIIPISRGGSHYEGNWGIACRTCNLQKSSLLLMEFKRRKGLIYPERC